ncbi:putative major pilin subunit [uncultured Clostridium sp.]|uniref:prepilin-type N-terminal cleavage/methylation domain-containing protein n=1 Tax=uncultured Clostridium sp. TaxID=59620 RepID=UPI000822AA04|nr:prepilin-type N-terminal cleavage/methylation domain-containing protein [uncultured Clostridium sp.]SCJ33805.1 putative major pilin subunit [uncultured Clostridium sp.]
MTLNLEIKTNYKKRKKLAFTLIELVVVIAIIAVLAAAFTPKLSGYMDEARKVGVLDQAKRVLTAYESVNLKTNVLTESSPISSVINSSGGLVTTDEITKIPLTFTISQCRNILNTEKFDFTMTNGVVSEINSLR